MKNKKLLIIMALLASVLLIFSACSKTEDTLSDKTNESQSEQSDQTEESVDDTTNETKEDTQVNPQVKVVMESKGEFIIELYPEYAPATVENFLKLVNEGFYDGLTFHRVIDGFMAQGGDPLGTGTGGSDETIKGEFSSNGFSQNTLSHTRGVISMARSALNDSASSQFFICYSDGCAALDGDYAAFGKVIEGMEVVDSFCEVEMTYNSNGEKAVPVDTIYIKSMTQIK